MGIPALAQLIAATVNGSATASSLAQAGAAQPAVLDFAALLAEQLPPGLPTKLLDARGEPPPAGEGGPAQADAFPPGLALGLDHHLAPPGLALGLGKRVSQPAADSASDATGAPVSTAPSLTELTETPLLPASGSAQATIAQAASADMPSPAADDDAESGASTATVDLAALGLLPGSAAPAAFQPARPQATRPTEERPATSATPTDPPGATPSVPLAVPTLPEAITRASTAPATPAAERALPLRPAPEQQATAQNVTVNPPTTAKLAADNAPAASEAAPPFFQLPAAPAASLERTNDTAPSSAPVRVDTPLHDRHWAPSFSERVVWLAKNEQLSAQISIHPPQLGPIQISLNLSGDQANAVFASPHAEVRQAIQDALPQLRDMLAASGINLGQANVGSQLAQERRELAAQFAHENRSSGENAILPGDKLGASSTSALPIQRGRGLVDLFA